MQDLHSFQKYSESCLPHVRAGDARHLRNHSRYHRRRCCCVLRWSCRQCFCLYIAARVAPWSRRHTRAYHHFGHCPGVYRRVRAEWDVGAVATCSRNDPIHRKSYGACESLRRRGILMVNSVLATDSNDSAPIHCRSGLCCRCR